MISTATGPAGGAAGSAAGAVVPFAASALSLLGQRQFGVPQGMNMGDYLRLRQQFFQANGRAPSSAEELQRFVMTLPPGPSQAGNAFMSGGPSAQQPTNPLQTGTGLLGEVGGLLRTPGIIPGASRSPELPQQRLPTTPPIPGVNPPPMPGMTTSPLPGGGGGGLGGTLRNIGGWLQNNQGWLLPAGQIATGLIGSRMQSNQMNRANELNAEYSRRAMEMAEREEKRRNALSQFLMPQLSRDMQIKDPALLGQMRYPQIGAMTGQQG